MKDSNMSQEVNVSVAVRVRPLLPKETLAGEQTCIRVIPKNNQLIMGKDRAFTFDHVLPSKTTQNEVYNRCVSPLVKNCFEGYNATVFAYGQTGSGKTYTMGGGNVASQTEDEFGVLPRAISEMWEIITKNHNREYTLKVSYIEIYCEELRDLLETETSSKDLHIREDDKGNTLIVGACELECESVDEVMSCLEQGAIYRHTGSTAMNDHSSRSHSVFTILIEQRWVDGDLGLSRKVKSKGKECEVVEEDADGEKEISHYMCAKFHFVDLAGSERAHRTGNVGDRFKESIHINSGLLALGNVISALGDTNKKKSTHIPYRDSKITRLLKDSLGGNANTVMVCCISPTVSNFDETHNALKYANRARNIKNKPIVNRDPQSVRFEEMQSEIKALREELHRHRTSVMTVTATAGKNTDSRELQRAIQEVGQIKDLEDKAARLQTECSNYRMIAEEAYKQLMEIQSRDVLTQSMTLRLGDWLELMEEIKNKVPSTLSKDAWDNQKINTLQTELQKCQSDLKNDEEIFAEKAREMNQLQERITELESQMEEGVQQIDMLQDRVAQQEEQLVGQQVTIENLTAQLKEKAARIEELERGTQEIDLNLSEGPPTTTRRAKSVPASMLGNRNQLTEPPTRNIHTSPALFSVERVMAGFRARSQLLVGRLEDGDDVLQQAFSDEDEDSMQAKQGGNKEADKKKSPFQRNTKQRGRQAPDRIDVLDVSKIHSTEQHERQLKKAEMEMRMSTQKARDLSINIRLKEQLIKELVKTGREATAMNQQYEEKITSLEKEKNGAKMEMAGLQKALNELEQKESHDKTEKERLQLDFRKKMELTKTRLHALSKKQKDTERLATVTGANNKRIQQLESAVDKMKSEQERLMRKLKDESERKSKLERDMAKEQQRVRELEARNAQQKKVLKVKTEEMAAVQRKLRSGSSLPANSYRSKFLATRFSEEQARMDDQKKWIDSEIEKVVEQRRQMEDLEKELGKREDILAKKEAMLAERNELEMKKLRSSQVISKDIKTVSMKLESVERRIEEKTKEATSTPREQQGNLRDELKSLQSARDKLKNQREGLDSKLRDGAVLSTQEERRLIELEEYVEALDAAIDYKNDAIQNRQQELRRSVILSQSEDNLMAKLKSLSSVETRTLLSRYFEKVIELRNDERKKNLQCSELEMRVDEQERVIADLESSLQRVGMEGDRRLTQQQQEYEKKLQVVMRQLNESSTAGSGSPTSNSLHSSVDKEKLEKLERELYYYKKTSRDAKKKLKELLTSQLVPKGDSDKAEIESLLMPTPRETVQDSIPTKPVTPRSQSSRSKGDVDRLSMLRDGGGTPVRLSRKDLRRMSNEEVSMRKSAVRESEILPQDSLESSRNPWT